MLSKFKQDILKKIEEAGDIKALDDVYRCYFGRKGELTDVLRSLKDLPEEERKEKGKVANQIKQELEVIFNQKKLEIQKQNHRGKSEWVDITAPGTSQEAGHLHPITQVRRQVEEIFQSMGFSVVDGPEVESEHYNFDVLNVPKDHPARDLWDTFWLRGDYKSQISNLKQIQNSKLLLRTHTSPAQARCMEENNPPLRIIAPGRCFRHEAVDASHDVQFYQVEGLMVDKDISVVHFKGILQEFFKQFFGGKLEIRLRPSYFPFVEPGFEVDVKREGGGWLELMGAGMVHPNVFKAVGYNPTRYQGFAFGMGLDRLAMMKYRIDDIRLFYSGDLRFLNQF